MLIPLYILPFLGVLSTSYSAFRTQQQHAFGPALGPAKEKAPNIVLILTDDQDLHMNSLDYMPLLKKYITDQGTLYKKHFCTTAICCPARVSLLTGKLAHNTNVTDVYPPFGGYPKFVNQGLQKAYLPVWLQAAGYDTYYAGKLFNAHTVLNYDKPFAPGWTHSDFLLDPFTYSYYNSSFQRDQDEPVSYEGEHSVDVLASKSLAFLEQASRGTAPFFLGIAPPAPHTNVEFTTTEWNDTSALHLGGINISVEFLPPIPAHRHEHLFPDIKVPRTPHFAPETPSGVSWIAEREPTSERDIESFDHFYRQRLRTLQSVDELVESVVHRLEALKILDNTYIFYTTDNGYHIGQHRLPPGKECGIEEDINIPLIVRGPGVPIGETDVVTTHTDFVPTILELAGSRLPVDLDGKAIPLTNEDISVATRERHEHVTVEFWGFADFEYGENDIATRVPNNTYKAVRIVGQEFNLYYSVWCNNEKELYDLHVDPYQRRTIS